VERRKEEPMGMRRVLCHAQLNLKQIDIPLSVFACAQIFVERLPHSKTKNLTSIYFASQLHNISQGGPPSLSLIHTSQKERKGKDSLARTEKERSSKMADFGFLLPDRLKSRLDLNQQHQRKSESFEHRLEKAKLKRQVCRIAFASFLLLRTTRTTLLIE